MNLGEEFYKYVANPKNSLLSVYILKAYMQTFEKGDANLRNFTKRLLILKIK